MRADGDTGANPEPDLEIVSLKAENLMLRAALNELVRLKDGPRDADYERRKPHAWDMARRVLKMSITKGQP